MPYSVIFLNPSVLMHKHDRTNWPLDQPDYFDQKAFNSLNTLIHRTNNAAIVLISTCKDENNPLSLEQLKAAYQDCDLGEYIIGKIDDPRSHLIDDETLIKDWLYHNTHAPNPLPIHSFVIISHSKPTHYRSQSVCVRDFLNKPDVESAERILTQYPLDPSGIPAQDIMSEKEDR